MSKSYCKFHRKWEDVSNFDKREDRECYYSWCRDAMVEQGRSTDYPKQEERGFGRTF
jgi:hypothetical protein